ncbi:AbiV family abortive infection protein [Streptomyces bacillaris]
MNALAQHRRSHAGKHLQAVIFGDDLAEFWGDCTAVPAMGSSYEEWEQAHKARQQEAEAAARTVNLAKQRGLYVDRYEKDTVLSLTRISAGTTGADLQTAARVVELLLINDHVRMMLAATPYDGTYEQQFRLLPVAHPEDWAAATGPAGPEGERGVRSLRRIRRRASPVAQVPDPRQFQCRASAGADSRSCPAPVR